RLLAETGRLADPDPQTGPVTAAGFPQAAPHDSAGGPARTAKDPDWRYCAANDGWSAVGAAARSPTGCGAEPYPQGPPAGDPGAFEPGPPFVVENSTSGFENLQGFLYAVRPTAQARVVTRNWGRLVNVT